VGVGVTLPEGRGTDLKTCLERLIRKDNRFAPRFEGASQIEMHRGYIPDEAFPVDPYGDGFIIIGDAASQASVLAGEGIRFAMEMGRIAGKVCAEAVQKEDCSKQFLGQAHAQWNRVHRRDFRIALEINARMAAFNDTQWDKGVEYLKRLSSRQFLSFLKTEFSLGLFMGIVARNPGLAGKVLVKRMLQELRKGET
jgi:digeranylgeranylglycerophospholipid reductase